MESLLLEPKFAMLSTQMIKVGRNTIALYDQHRVSKCRRHNQNRKINVGTKSKPNDRVKLQIELHMTMTETKIVIGS